MRAQKGPHLLLLLAALGLVVVLEGFLEVFCLSYRPISSGASSTFPGEASQSHVTV
jgi:hypothetical protein